MNCEKDSHARPPLKSVTVTRILRSDHSNGRVHSTVNDSVIVKIFQFLYYFYYYNYNYYYYLDREQDDQRVSLLLEDI